MSQPDPKLLADIEREARLFATPIARQIAERANTEPLPPAFAGTCASLVLQTTLVSLATTHFHPGSPEGEAWLRETYDGIVKDAVARWHKSDLKERGLGPRGQG